MSYSNYSEVRLLSDAYQSDGLSKGAIGYIIEVWEEGVYEVEFSNPAGTTIALLALPESEIELSEIKNDDTLS